MVRLVRGRVVKLVRGKRTRLGGSDGVDSVCV